MAVNSKTITGRRAVRFDSLDALLADAERLAALPRVKMLGNWPLGQLFTHLATAMNGSIDGISARAPVPIRLLGPLLKHRILQRGMTAGFRLPPEGEAVFFPPAASTADALAALQTAIARAKVEPMTAVHPVFGRLSHEEWTKLHLRHGELHLSFAVPE